MPPQVYGILSHQLAVLNNRATMATVSRSDQPIGESIRYSVGMVIDVNIYNPMDISPPPPGNSTEPPHSRRGGGGREMTTTFKCFFAVQQKVLLPHWNGMEHLWLTSRGGRDDDECGIISDLRC